MNPKLPEQIDSPIGLIAGWGQFPVEIAEAICGRGLPLVTVGLSGLASDELGQFSTEYREMSLLRIGAHLRYLRSRGVRHVLMAGKIFKDKVLYQGMGWIEYCPDLTCIRILGGSFITKRRDGRDDTVLSAVVQEYERKGMSVLPITEVAPQLLCSPGVLTAKRLHRSVQLDAEFGWKIARQMGGLDVGQSITVKDQLVLGVEAIEGTDGLIDRTAKLCPRGGFSLIKVAKPNQDMRFDVPTIGPRTVERMSKAGGTSIVIEAGQTILLERDRTLELANRLGIAIVARTAQELNQTDEPQAARVA